MKKFYNLRDSYKSYKEISTKPVDISLYLSIVNNFMLFLAAKLFHTGEIKLPQGMGVVSIIGRKQKLKVEDGKIKGLAPDWKATRELWESNEEAKANKQVVYHFNEETHGIRYRFRWSKNRVLMQNKSMYRLIMTRTNKRALAKLIKQGKEYLIT